MSLVNSISVESLIERILNETVEILPEEELQLLNHHKDLVAEFLIPVIDFQMEMMSINMNKVNGNVLYWGFAILSFLKNRKVFQFLKELCWIETEMIDHVLGNAFITECLSWMIAATVGEEWDTLKEVIENSELDEFIRGACIEAIAILAVRKEISREEMIGYFKECLQKILCNQLDDEALATQLITVFMDIWPGECIEEIKELYGVGLVDSSPAEIDDLLDCFLRGREACLKEFYVRIHAYHPLHPIIGNFCLFRERRNSVDLEEFSKEADNAYIAAEAILSNEPYDKKKLIDCLIEEEKIVFNLDVCPEIQELPKQDQEKIHQLHEKLIVNPKDALQEALDRLLRFPNNPVIYSHLYIIYCELNWKREAVALIKKMVGKFPDHLFGLVEYSKYLLKRGESEKVFELLSGCTTLSEMYPERQSFNQVEWQLFSHVMALYYIKVEDYHLAKDYLEILEMIDPNSKEVEEVEEKLRMGAFSKALRKKDFVRYR